MLEHRLGAGAMGEVWAARHVSLGERVAIKVVARQSFGSSEDGVSTESRFLLEARVAAALSKKTRHIVSVTDHGEEGGYAYLVMELLEGECLDAYVERTGPMPIRDAAMIVQQVAKAVAVAHAEGVIHRDLKTTNVLLTRDENGLLVAKVLDFGIAKLRVPKGDARATQRGFLLGTPAYMSPEQARGGFVDHRTDVWALAVLAYHLLSREFPFDGPDIETLLSNVCTGHAAPVRRHVPALPPLVDDFFERAFDRALDQRFQSATAFATAFGQLEKLAGTLQLNRTSTPGLSYSTRPPPPRGRRRSSGLGRVFAWTAGAFVVAGLTTALVIRFVPVVTPATPTIGAPESAQPLPPPIATADDVPLMGIDGAPDAQALPSATPKPPAPRTTPVRGPAASAPPRPQPTPSAPSEVDRSQVF